MKHSRILTVLLCVAMTAAAAPAASGQRKSKHRKSAAGVLKLIPASAAGYIVVPNVKAAATRVDRFLKKIGVNALPGGILPMIKAAGMLGEGFNADGGLAVVVLDPAQTGLDIIKLLKDGPNAKPPKPEDMPVVVFVPGKGVKEVFGQAAAADGKYFKVKLPMAPIALTAAYKDGYIILSPSVKAIKAVLAERRTADKYTEPEHLALISRGDISIHLNVKVVGPIYSTLMKTVKEQMEATGTRDQAMLNTTKIIAMYRNIIDFDQVDAMTFSARLTASNVILEEVASLTPGSDLAKAALAPVTTRPRLDRVANMPYVLAFGGVRTQDETAIRVSQKMASGMIDSLTGLLPKEAIARINKLKDKFISQVTGIQTVAGGAPAGSGLFGTACVLTCKDSSVVKGLLADSTALIGELIKSLAEDEPDAKGVSIAYQKGVESSGKLPVDALVLSHPEITNMNQNERETMSKIVGEDKIRVLIAAPNKNTVVLTFGGSLPFLDESVKAAGGDGKTKLLTRRQLRAMKKYMPSTLTTIGLYNVGNLFEVILTGMQTMMPNGPAALPVNITTKDPIVMAGGVTGKAAHLVFAVPIPLIREVKQAVTTVTGGMMGGGGPMPPAPNNDF